MLPALLCLATARGAAPELRVVIRTAGGEGVADVVVTANSAISAARATPGVAILDQQHLSFVPQVLVVPTGTVVSFPNNDTVSHQVYSFSPAKRFQLPLYKGRSHAPVTFDAPGLVVLGCNIHDDMVGYVYVTDAPYFATSDATGTAHLGAVPPGEYRLTLWGPRVADPPPTLTRTVQVDAAGAVLDVRLTRRLRSRPEPRPRSGDWEY